MALQHRLHIFQRIKFDPPQLRSILFSFYYGFLLSPVPGGILANLCPAHRTFGVALCLTALLNLLIPAAASIGSDAVVPVRALQGLCEVGEESVQSSLGIILRNTRRNSKFLILESVCPQGVLYPACHGIWRDWAPPMERTRMATLAFAGYHAGYAVGIPLVESLIDNHGWLSGFYFYGILGLIW